MIVKTVPPIQMVSITRRLPPDQVPAVAPEMISKLREAAASLGLTPDGPRMFLYSGFTSPEAPFDVEFAQPVSGMPGEPAEMPEAQPRTTAPFKCLAATHHGSLATIMDTWGALQAEIARAGHVVTGQSREVFVRYGGFEHAENETEIQIGIH